MMKTLRAIFRLLLVPGTPTWGVVGVKAFVVIGVPLLFARMASAGVVELIPGGEAIEGHSVEALLTMLILQNVFGLKFGTGGADSPAELKRRFDQSHQDHKAMMTSIHAVSATTAEALAGVCDLRDLHAPTRHGDTLVYDWKLAEEDKAAIRSLPRLVSALERALTSVGPRGREA